MFKSTLRYRNIILSDIRKCSYSMGVGKDALFLNPHKWEGLPADQIFELHNLRKEYFGDKYNPNDEERNLILSTAASLSSSKPSLEYVYEIENFKERHMNNTPVNERGLPPRRSNIKVVNRGETMHERRRIEQLNRISAYEMPLLAKFSQEYIPRAAKDTPLRLTYFTDFTDETNAHNRRVTLSCKIEDLGLDPTAERKIKLLSGNKFNHNTNVFSMTTSRFPVATQNAKWLVETFSKLLEESSNKQDDFSDIPLDTRHSKPQKVSPEFPQSWKRPEHAPIAKHKVVNRIVSNVIKAKEEQYIDKYSP